MAMCSMQMSMYLQRMNEGGRREKRIVLFRGGNVKGFLEQVVYFNLFQQPATSAIMLHEE